MKKNIILAGLIVAGLTGAARAEEGLNLQELDQRVKVLERQLENQADDASAAKKSTAVVTADTNGFGIYSADKAWGLKLGGLVQIDDRTFIDDYNPLPSAAYGKVGGKSTLPANGGYQADSILPRRVRLSETLSLGQYAGAFLQEEFIPSSSNPAVVDAYGELKPLKWATLRVGLQKTPLSLERWRSDPARDFVEFSYLAGLVTDRDTGAWLELKDADQIAYFGAGVFDGSNDTGSTEVVADNNKDKDAVAKLFFQPFRATGLVTLRDIGVGVAGSAGDHSGSALPTDKSLGQGQTIFSLSNTAAVKGDGGDYRLVPQAYAYYGSLSFLGEYLREGGAYVFNGQEYYLTNESWDAQLGWWLTGEDASFSAVKLNPNSSHSWGALQLAGRYSGINFDPGYAANGVVDNSKNTVVSAVRSWDVALNYVPTNNVKVLVDYAESYFTDGGGIDLAGARLALAPEKVLFTRVQFNF